MAPKPSCNIDRSTFIRAEKNEQLRRDIFHNYGLCFPPLPSTYTAWTKEAVTHMRRTNFFMTMTMFYIFC